MFKNTENNEIMKKLKNKHNQIYNISNEYEYLENDARKRMNKFFDNNNLKNHIIQIEIRKGGKFIDIYDLSENGPHIPLDILMEFCEEFSVILLFINYSTFMEFDNIKKELLPKERDCEWEISLQYIE